MMIESENIPAELRALPQWVAWRLEVRDGKPTKPPYDVKSGTYASHANPKTWVTFREAIAFKQRNADVQGVGFVFTKRDTFAGVDLDKCRDAETGTVEPWAQAIVSNLNSYTEVSPNQTGLHIIVCGSVPSGVKRNGIEIYDQLRYFTVTGHHVPGTPQVIEERSGQLTALYESVAPAPEPQQPRTEPQYVDVDDAELLEKARQSAKGDRFIRLFDRGDFTEYESHSNADLALCSDLAFWTNRDVARIDSLFRMSGLMRPKWDERHFGDGRTYGQATITLACSGVTEGYEPTRSVPIIDESEFYAAQDEARAGAAPPEAEYVPAVEPGSFIADYVSYASERTDAPSQAHELMAVGILSALAGPRPRLQIASHVGGEPLCLWTMYVVDSTVGRKSTVLNFAVDILSEVLTSSAIIPWEGSPQGIIQKMQERDGKPVVFVRDEYSGLMKQMKSAGGHMAGMEQMFIRAFDGGVIENIRTRKKSNRKDMDGNAIYEKDTDRVERPYLVKLCASTRTAMVERCTIDDVISGFLPRFLFVTGSAEPRPPIPFTQEMGEKRRDLILYARAFHEKASKLSAIPVSPVVLEMAWGVEQAWGRIALDMARPDAGRPSLKRLADSVLKVAALIAIDEWREGELVVMARHYSQAYRLGQRWIDSTVMMINDLGSTSFMREMDAVAGSVSAKPGVSKSELLRKHRGVRRREFDEILDTLEGRETIERRVLLSQGGRPGMVFFPFGTAPNPSETKDGNKGKERKEGKKSESEAK